MKTRAVIADDASAWEQFYRQVKSTIRNKSKYYAKKYRFLRLYKDDFKSEFNLVFWELAREEHYSNDISFFSKLLGRIDSRAINLVKQANAAKRKAHHTALRLITEDELEEGEKGVVYDYLDDNYSLEDDVTSKILVEQILKADTLTDSERALLHYMYENPDASNRAIGEALGIHHQQVARILEKIREKLEPYREGMAWN